MHGQATAAPELTKIIEQTVGLWLKHPVNYDQSKYVVAQARKLLQRCAPKARRRTIDRRDRNEGEKLIEARLQHQSKSDLLIKV